ncbi:MAG: hypothetical protein WCF03_04280 [Nitrososphaeraceae archaeon]
MAITYRAFRILYEYPFEAEIEAEAHQKHDLHNRNVNARLEPK